MIPRRASRSRILPTARLSLKKYKKLAPKVGLFYFCPCRIRLDRDRPDTFGRLRTDVDAAVDAAQKASHAWVSVIHCCSMLILVLMLVAASGREPSIGSSRMPPQASRPHEYVLSVAKT